MFAFDGNAHTHITILNITTTCLQLLFPSSMTTFLHVYTHILRIFVYLPFHNALNMFPLKRYLHSSVSLELLHLFVHLLINQQQQ